MRTKMKFLMHFHALFNTFSTLTVRKWINGGVGQLSADGGGHGRFGLVVVTPLKVGMRMSTKYYIANNK